MTQGKRVIYVNGDSFTAGAETADYLLPFKVDKHSLNEIRTADLNQRSLMIDKQHELIKHCSLLCQNDPDLCHLISEEEKKNRWSFGLEKLLGKTVMNISSHGGSSMFAICYRTISDINELIEQGYEVTDILIQITSPSRASIFQTLEDKDEPIRTFLEHKRYNIKSGNILYSPDDMQNYVREFFLLEKPGYNLYRYFHDLYMLKHTLKSIVPNARLIFLDSVFLKNTIYPSGTPWEDDVNLEFLGNNHILTFKKEFEEVLDLCMLDFISPDEKELTPGHHFTKKIHDRFANAIAMRYFNE